MHIDISKFNIIIALSSSTTAYFSITHDKLSYSLYFIHWNKNISCNFLQICRHSHIFMVLWPLIL